MVGQNFCQFVQGLFQIHQAVAEANKTFITLIPKKEEVSFIKDFRLISLYNVVYKAITRLLSLRIKPHMSNLVGPCQSSFDSYSTGDLPLYEK